MIMLKTGLRKSAVPCEYDFEIPENPFGLEIYTRRILKD